MPRLLAIALLAALVHPAASARPKTPPNRPAPAESVVDAPPVLVTTKGEENEWSSVDDLEAAAEKGHALASFEYARLLETGSQVAKDPDRALAYYRRAAEAGQRDALFRLGKIHHDGLLGVEVDYPTAIDYYRRAAAGRVPEAMYNIGAMLLSARGVKRDYVAGLAWLLVAEQHGADAKAGIEQVRQRLARYPQRLAAAEARAGVLAETLQASEVPQLDGTPMPKPEQSEPPRPAATAAPKPAIDVERPPVAPPLAPEIGLERPSIAVPAPPPNPPPPPKS